MNVFICNFTQVEKIKVAEEVAIESAESHHAIADKH
jgi:hypothetical protein